MLQDYEKPHVLWQELLQRSGNGILLQSGLELLIRALNERLAVLSLPCLPLPEFGSVILEEHGTMVEESIDLLLQYALLPGSTNFQHPEREAYENALGLLPQWRWDFRRTGELCRAESLLYYGKLINSLRCFQILPEGYYYAGGEHLATCFFRYTDNWTGEDILQRFKLEIESATSGGINRQRSYFSLQNNYLDARVGAARYVFPEEVVPLVGKVTHLVRPKWFGSGSAVSFPGWAMDQWNKVSESSLVTLEPVMFGPPLPEEGVDGFTEYLKLVLGDKFPEAVMLELQAGSMWDFAVPGGFEYLM